MKRYYFLLIVLILSIGNTFAQDDCKTSIETGMEYYRNKDYINAKKYFDHASKVCDNKPANLSNLIVDCDNKIAEAKAAANEKRRQQAAQRKTQTTEPDETITIQTTLTVSANKVSFDALGKDATINVYTNAPKWEISTGITWCDITPASSSSLQLVCQPNINETPRNDSFYITAGDQTAKITVLQNVADDPVTLGNILYKEGKFDDAFILFTRGVARGDAEAQYRLGKMYLEGTGVAENQIKAMGLFKKSAEKGNVSGMNALGYMYETRENPDYKEAVKWYRKSAEKGYPEAQCNLGMMYKYGLGVKQSDREAKKWIQKCEKQGVTPFSDSSVGKLIKGTKQWIQKNAKQILPTTGNN